MLSDYSRIWQRNFEADENNSSLDPRQSICEKRFNASLGASRAGSFSSCLFNSLANTSQTAVRTGWTGELAGPGA